MQQGGLDGFLFFVQTVALGFSGYAGKYYYDAAGNPLTYDWAFPRLMAALAVANVTLLVWLVVAIRRLRSDVEVLEVGPDGQLRRARARLGSADD